jgi:hypothetical protein
MRLDTAASRSRSLPGVALSQAAAPRGFRRPTEFAAAAGGAYPVERVGCIRSTELARLNLSRKPPRPLKIATSIKGRRFPAVVDQRPWSRIRRAPPFPAALVHTRQMCVQIPSFVSLMRNFPQKILLLLGVSYTKSRPVSTDGRRNGSVGQHVCGR